MTSAMKYKYIPRFDRSLFCGGKKPYGVQSDSSLNIFWNLVENDEDLNLFEKLAMLFILSRVVDEAFATRLFTEGQYKKLKSLYIVDVFRNFNKKQSRKYKFIHWFRSVFRFINYGVEHLTPTDKILEATYKLFIYSRVSSLYRGAPYFSMVRELQDALVEYLKK